MTFPGGPTTLPIALMRVEGAIQMEPTASLKVDPTIINTLIVSSAILVGVGLVAASVVMVLIGRSGYISGAAPEAARSFGLVFQALPALTTIVFIVLATATLRAMGFLPATGWYRDFQQHRFLCSRL
jgi:hypothetical protein